MGHETAPAGRRAAPGGAVRHVEGEVVWRLEGAAPDLAAAAEARAPEALRAARALSSGVPAARGIDPFDEGEYVRPFRHLRAFYRRLPGGGVLGFKGTEIQADDLADKLRALGDFRVEYPSRGRSLFSLLEHFPYVEQKIPLAVSLAEAREDAESALAVQAAHLSRFGELARVPLPLAVVRWPEPSAAAFKEVLAPMLTARAARIVEAVAAGGLGCLVYYYPCVPLRVAHLDAVLAGGGAAVGEYEGRRRALRGLAAAEATVESWVDLVARMLALGFLPSSIESHGLGHCLEAQNAVADGGFVDLASLKTMAAVADGREFYETLLCSVIDLAKTVRTFMAGSLADADAEYKNPTLTMMLVAGRVWEALADRVRAYAGAGGADPRLREAFASEPLAPALEQGLRQLFPAVTARSRHADNSPPAAEGGGERDES